MSFCKVCNSRTFAKRSSNAFRPSPDIFVQIQILEMKYFYRILISDEIYLKIILSILILRYFKMLVVYIVV